jgi:hypothetical protein
MQLHLHTCGQIVHSTNSKDSHVIQNSSSTVPSHNFKHLFWDCQKSKNIWFKLVEWLQSLNIEINFPTKNKAFLVITKMKHSCSNHRSKLFLPWTSFSFIA